AEHGAAGARERVEIAGLERGSVELGLGRLQLAHGAGAAADVGDAEERRRRALQAPLRVDDARGLRGARAGRVERRRQRLFELEDALLARLVALALGQDRPTEAAEAAGAGDAHGDVEDVRPVRHLGRTLGAGGGKRAHRRFDGRALGGVGDAEVLVVRLEAARAGVALDTPLQPGAARGVFGGVEERAHQRRRLLGRDRPQIERARGRAPAIEAGADALDGARVAVL